VSRDDHVTLLKELPYLERPASSINISLPTERKHRVRAYGFDCFVSVPVSSNFTQA
jgi:hypothetical protein